MSKYETYADPANLGAQEPEDMFAPHHYTAIREKGRQMRGLPLWCYTSERFHKAEIEKVFLPSWTMLEREEVTPNVGDFHCIIYLGVNYNSFISGKGNCFGSNGSCCFW